MEGSKEQPEPKHKDPDENQILDPYGELHKAQEKLIFGPTTSLSRTPPGTSIQTSATPPGSNSHGSATPPLKEQPDTVPPRENAVTPLAPIFANCSKRKEISPLSNCNDKRTKLELINLSKLKQELAKLNEIIAGAKKTKTEIKSSVNKLVVLSELVEVDIQSQFEPVKHESTAHHAAETAEIGTQTPQSIDMEFTADTILAQLGDPEKHSELISKDWPPSAFKRTKLKRGGFFTSRAGTTRVIIAVKGQLEKNETICRLANTFPMLKRIKESALAAGKIATIRCGEEFYIDGENNGDDSQNIIIGATDSLNHENVLSLLAKVVDEMEKGNTVNATVQFPHDLDVHRARKMLEIALHARNINADLVTSKQQRAAYQQKTGQTAARRPSQRQQSLTFRPISSEVTLADIVKGIQENANPQKSGVEIKAIRETARGGIQVRYREESNNPVFYEKMRSALAATATCHQKTSAVIISNIELGADETTVVKALADTLGVSEGQFVAGKMTNRRSLVVSMPDEIRSRAVQLRRVAIILTMASIREKIDPDYCNNCQNFGHSTRSCKSEQTVDKRCMNCGECGHLSTTCENEMSCFSCKVKGHRGNSMACPAFRALVHEKRNNNKNV